MDIEFYGASYCHLCDEAEAILHGIGVEAGYIDIAEDSELKARYGLRIPVLRRLDTGAELGWPFDAARVLDFLNKGG